MDDQAYPIVVVTLGDGWPKPWPEDATNYAHAQDERIRTLEAALALYANHDNWVCRYELNSDPDSDRTLWLGPGENGWETAERALHSKTD